MFYDKNSEEPWNAFFSGAENRRAGRFFLEQKIGVLWVFFFWSRKICSGKAVIRVI